MNGARHLLAHLRRQALIPFDAIFGSSPVRKVLD